MILKGIKTPIIEPGDDYAEILIRSMESIGVTPRNGDILVVAENIIGTAEGRIIDLGSIRPSPEDLEYAKKYGMDPRLVSLILKEADKVIGGVKGVLLTLKDGMLIANAGIDMSNSGGPDKAVLYPTDPMGAAAELTEKIAEKFGLSEFGVIIADSRVLPLRKGTVGVAIGVYGFEPVENCIGRRDLFGRELKITLRALADGLATAAEILMGEADERTPAVLIRDAPVKFTRRRIDPEELMVPYRECLYVNSFEEFYLEERSDFGN